MLKQSAILLRSNKLVLLPPDIINILSKGGDFMEKLKFARLWGHGKFEGQRINRDYLLQDKDIIELHI